LDIRPKSIKWILFLTQLKILIIVGYIGFSLITNEEQEEVIYIYKNSIPILILSSIVLYAIKTKYIMVVRVCLIFDFVYALAQAPPLGILISVLLLVLSYTETAKIYLDPINANKQSHYEQP
jgi:amino acid permease